ASGGLGQVEQVWSRLTGDPSRLPDGMEHALSYCPRQQNTAHLLAALARRKGSRMAVAFAEVRNARDLGAAEYARRQLVCALRRAGLEAGRGAVASLLVRVLRPGSTPVTDALMHGVNRLWRRREGNLKLEIDA